jgi:hypothetical protein
MSVGSEYPWYCRAIRGENQGKFPTDGIAIPRMEMAAEGLFCRAKSRMKPSLLRYHEARSGETRQRPMRRKRWEMDKRGSIFQLAQSPRAQVSPSDAFWNGETVQSRFADRRTKEHQLASLSWMVVWRPWKSAGSSSPCPGLPGCPRDQSHELTSIQNLRIQARRVHNTVGCEVASRRSSTSWRRFRAMLLSGTLPHGCPSAQPIPSCSPARG